MTIFDVQNVLLFIASFVMAYFELKQVKALKGTGAGFIKIVLGVLGIYFSGYFLRIVLDIDLGTISHPVWVGTPLLIFISTVAAGAYLSSRRLK